MIPYALFNSKISFEPFQYKPFFEFFENTDKDLYIADEVGVGKTIETGIILSELIYGNRNHKWIQESLENVLSPRILILAPPALCAQWKAELEDKFMLSVYDCYTSKLGKRMNAQIVVYAESWQQLQKLENDESTYDLLVVDEVHNFRNEYTEDIFSGEKRDSRKYRSLEKIAKRAKRKIFLSATPVFNTKKDFLNETRLLTQEYCITASTKSVSKCLDFQPRIESILVKLNDAEMNLYNAIKNVSSINQITKSAVYLHEGCSSMPCLAKTLTESVENYLKDQFKDNELEEEYEDFIRKIFEYVEDDDYDSLYELQKSTKDFQMKVILWGLFKKKELEEYGIKYLKEKDKYKDSKLEKLDEIVEKKLISENGYEMKHRHIVIFAHYIATCNYVYDHFVRKYRTDFDVLLATGEHSKEEIDRKISEFKESCITDDRDSVIICSDVCREGKNMQECQVLINFDLPFSPSIMQQRIGRIDRNGQAHTPLIFNLICNVDNDIHTYYEIIFEKIRVINGISGICGVDVIKETNIEVQDKVLKQWKINAEKDAKNFSNSYSALQNGYLKYLRREYRMTNSKEIKKEIDLVDSFSDEEILEKMKHILFMVPNEELKRIREEEHNSGKKFIAQKFFEKNLGERESLRERMCSYIESKMVKYINDGFIAYDMDSDTYQLDLSNKKEEFLCEISKRQYFKWFKALENRDGRRGTVDMYYDEGDISFVTAIYKEILSPKEKNGMSLNEFMETMGLAYEDCFVALEPLCEILNSLR